MRLHRAAFCIVIWLLASALDVNADDKVTIEIQGRIAPECRLSFPKGSFELTGSLNAAGHSRIPLNLFCNSPFEYVVTSRYGHLQREGLTGKAATVSDSVPYSMSVSVPTTAGISRMECTSTAMTEGSGCLPSHSRGGVSTGADATVDIRWNSTGRLPESGHYSDELTFTVSAKL